MGASEETVASTLTWAIYELAKTPEVMAKAKREAPWLTEGDATFVPLPDRSCRLRESWVVVPRPPTRTKPDGK